MKKNKTIYFILFFASQLIWSQSSKLLFGKIVFDSTAVENVNITNINNKNTTISNKKGLFKIRVNVGDVLEIRTINMNKIQKKISDEDFKQELIVLKMNFKINQIKEVIVNENEHINAVNLGIISKNQKKYTPAERKLYTARSGILDPLLNLISGRTTMLKKEVIIERKEKLLQKLDGLYELNYYTDVLKIPENYIKGFQYYLIEDLNFIKALQSKNKTLTMFLIKKLALNYNEIISQQEIITIEK